MRLVWRSSPEEEEPRDEVWLDAPKREVALAHDVAQDAVEDDGKENWRNQQKETADQLFD